MILTFAEDFSSTTVLDSELIGKSDSGLYWNRGVHPILTTDNLVSLLPITDITFSDWSASAVYTNFSESRSKSDIVTVGGILYQSLQDANENNAINDTDYWLPTNIESLRIKSFIWSVEDNMKSALSIERKLIENQYIYNIGDNYRTLLGYNGWAFEPKGSDYVTIRINEMGIQADGTTPLPIYVINQGRLIDTLTLTPDDGYLSFERNDYEIQGKGVFYFIFDCGDGLSVKGDGYNDALKYSGFTCYPVSGSGESPESVDYTPTSLGNGLNFNVSAYLDSSIYLENNKIDFAKMLQTQMEMDFIKTLTMNTNVRANRNERALGDGVMNLLATEGFNTELNTIARKYNSVLKEFKASINRTFDKFLQSKPKFKVTRKTV